MNEPPPNTYETARDFISVLMEQSCGGLKFRVWGPTDPDALKHIRDRFNVKSFVKERVVKTACEAWTIVINQNNLIRKLKEENERLSAKLIEDHEEVITLHRELKLVREDQTASLGSVVKAAVDNSVKSYSHVLTSHAVSAPIAMDSRVMRKALQDASEAEGRANNVVIFGLPELESEAEDLKDAVSNVFDVLDVKPSFEVERIGKQQSGTIRPIIVKLRSAIAASGILRKTGKLKRNDSTKSVYICPDRTLMQRKEHRECVEELRRRCRDDTEKSHSIRDGVVVSVTKENSSGEKG